MRMMRPLVSIIDLHSTTPYPNGGIQHLRVIDNFKSFFVRTKKRFMCTVTNFKIVRLVDPVHRDQQLAFELRITQ